MTPQDIGSLAMTGATTIVAAMATDAWTGVRSRVVGLFRRSRSGEAAIEARLDANAALIAGADDTGRARDALIGLWRLELEQLLAHDPDASGRLSKLIAEIRPGLPADQQTQINVAGGRSVLPAVQNGNQNNYFMDFPDARRSGWQPLHDEDG